MIEDLAIPYQKCLTCAITSLEMLLPSFCPGVMFCTRSSNGVLGLESIYIQFWCAASNKGRIVPWFNGPGQHFDPFTPPPPWANKRECFAWLTKKKLQRTPTKTSSVVQSTHAKSPLPPSLQTLNPTPEGITGVQAVFFLGGLNEPYPFCVCRR